VFLYLTFSVAICHGGDDWSIVSVTDYLLPELFCISDRRVEIIDTLTP